MRTLTILSLLVLMVLMAACGPSAPTNILDLYDTASLAVPGKDYSVIVEPIDEEDIDLDKAGIVYYSVSYGSQNDQITAVVVYQVTPEAFTADITLTGIRYFRVYQSNVSGEEIVNPIFTDANTIMDDLCMEAAQAKSLQPLCY